MTAALGSLLPRDCVALSPSQLLDFSFYKAHAKMEALEAAGVPVYLRDETGTIVTLCNDGDGYCNITTFDWTQPAARQVWIEAITNMTATGFVDGIYADHSSEKGVGIGSNFNFTSKGEGPNQYCNGGKHSRGRGHQCYNFTYAFAASFNSWHYWSTNYTQDLLANTTGGPVIAGPLANMGIPCTFDGIRNAQQTSGLMMLEINCGCKPSKNNIAQFLAAAEEYNYVHCMGAADIEHALVAKTTFPEMDYKLGAPLGPAIEVPSKGSGVWHRTFAFGAWVLWDNNVRISPRSLLVVPITSPSPSAWFACTPGLPSRVLRPPTPSP